MSPANCCCFWGVCPPEKKISSILFFGELSIRKRGSWLLSLKFSPKRISQKMRKRHINFQQRLLSVGYLTQPFQLTEICSPNFAYFQSKSRSSRIVQSGMRVVVELQKRKLIERDKILSDYFLWLPSRISRTSSCALKGRAGHFSKVAFYRLTTE